MPVFWGFFDQIFLKKHCLFYFQDVESYIHRSGRTGRAGRTGICICFYQPRERGQLRYVEQKAVSRVKLFQAYYLNGALEKSSFYICSHK